MPPCLPTLRPCSRRAGLSDILGPFLALGLMLTAGQPCGGAMAAEAERGEGAEAAPAAQAERITPYIKLAPLQANVIEKGRLIATLAVAANLDSPTFETRQLARARMDRLNEGYLFALASFARTRVSLDRPVNVAVLAATLQRVTDGVLGPGVARVLIGFVALNKA